MSIEGIEEMPPTPAVREVDQAAVAAFLDAPLCEGNYWGRRNATVREYLVELLVSFWRGNATQKYGMVGESDWQYDLYEVVGRLGLVPAWQDGYGVGYRVDGSYHPEDRDYADALVVAAIRALGARQVSGDG